MATTTTIIMVVATEILIDTMTTTIIDITITGDVVVELIITMITAGTLMTEVAIDHPEVHTIGTIGLIPDMTIGFMFPKRGTITDINI